MKNKLKLLIGVAALVLATVNLQAQTNSITTVAANTSPSFTSALQMMGAAVTSATNWTFVAGYGRGLTGNKNLAFGDVAYNISDHVGIVAGYDYLWSSGQQSVGNVVKGGVTLSATIHPFAFIGSTFMTNIVCTPFVADLLATPAGGSTAGIGNIVTTGANFDVYAFGNFMLNAGVQYENRTGQGYWDGNYGLIHAGLTREF